MPTLYPYPVYRPSGVPWLGDVPAHWDVRRLKNVCRFAYGDSLSSENRGAGEVPVYGSNGQVGQHSTANTESPCIIIGRKGSFGKVTYVEHPAFAIDTTFFVDRRYTQSNIRWLSLMLPLLGLDEISHDSAVPGLNRNDAYEEAIPLPPLAEQAAIVRYLDRADELINRYISAKERLIALLEEQCQAVIHQAVTCGLDHDAPVKPSGVEWLSDVPAHWEVRRLKTLASINTGGRDTINRKEDGKYPFFVRSQTVEKIDTWSFNGEAVLTAGDGVGVGKVFHYVNGKFDYHQRVYKFSDFKGIVGKFFFHYFASTLCNVVSQGTAKSTVDSLRLPMLQSFPVALPTIAEQVAIIEYLDRATAGIDAAITRARRQIALVEEYRTRLIADAVTGQVDVREATVGVR